MSPAAENAIYWWLMGLLCGSMTLAWLLLWVVVARPQCFIPKAIFVQGKQSEFAVPKYVRSVKNDTRAKRGVLPISAPSARSVSAPPARLPLALSTAGTSGMSRQDFFKR